MTHHPKATLNPFSLKIVNLTETTLFNVRSPFRFTIAERAYLLKNLFDRFVG